jgi:aspartate aminotransferase
MDLANRLERIKEPQTIKMAKMARALAADGKNVINLSLGEPDFKTPDHIIDSAIQAMHDGYTKYTPVVGLPELREAICTKLKRDNQLDYTTDNIIVSTGAKQALANAILSIINPGDEVLVPTPYWVTYTALIDLAEGTNKFIESDSKNNYKITPEELEEAISEKSKLFIFSTPCNPSGAVYSKDELSKLADVFEKYPNCYIISDEIYEYINYTGTHESIAQFDSIKDRVIIVNGFSKGFAMTGWRLGYMAGPPAIVKACERIQGQFTSGANAMTQKAAVSALLGDLQPTYDMQAEFKKRREFVVKAFDDMDGIDLSLPEGAFYAFPDVSSFFGKNGIHTSEDMSMHILNNAHVSTVYGSAFGNDKAIRISYAASMETLEDAMHRIKKLLHESK